MPMEISDNDLVVRAAAGDEDAFTRLVLRHQGPIKSYLYRLAACREDAEDLAQEVWIQIFTRLATFGGRSGVRPWLFAIATQVATGHHRVKARWPVEAQDKARALAAADPEVPETLRRIHWESPRARYEIREHVDFCFTCTMKTLPLEGHIALTLCEIYAFTAHEVAEVLGRSVEGVASLLHEARTAMRHGFERRCSLINQQGACHHCTELNSLFNPHQAEPQELDKLELVRAAQESAPRDLFELRTALVRSIDPLNAAGTNLHEGMMRVVRRANGGE
jgi:RNA polymerase sigma-70 factor, ECF subfamily